HRRDLAPRGEAVLARTTAIDLVERAVAPRPCVGERVDDEDVVAGPHGRGDRIDVRARREGRELEDIELEWIAGVLARGAALGVDDRDTRAKTCRDRE